MRRNLVVLTIVPNFQTRSLVRWVFEGEGHSLIETGGCSEAKLLLGNELNPDLVLIELGPSGSLETPQFHELLKNADNDKVCLILGMGDQRQYKDARSLGIKQFLMRPVTRSDLQTLLRGLNRAVEQGHRSSRIEDSAWWAIYTRYRCEKTVAHMLSTKGFEVYLPLYESVRRWTDRQKTLNLPLFPGYVFIRGGLDRRLEIITTPGVQMILSYGDRVAIIPDREIDAIRRTVEGPYHVEPHAYLNCGERVRVTRGSLRGIEGVLVRKKNLYRLVLSMDLLAQSVAVEIDAADVEPADARFVPGIFPAKQSARPGTVGEMPPFDRRQGSNVGEDGVKLG